MGALGFYFLGRFIGFYGLFIVVGAAAASFVGFIQCRRFRLDWNMLIFTCAVSGLLAIIGAKLLYIFVSFRSIDLTRLTDPAYINALMASGFVFYGGFLGFLLGLFLCHKVFKIDLPGYIQHCMACLPIAHGFGRFGCFAVGCCYGIPYDGWGAVTYSQSISAPNNIPLFPVQLVEAAGEFIIGAALILMCKKLKGYSALALYMILYSVLRFVLEFFRYDAERGSILGISTSQFISIIIFLSAFLIMYFPVRRGKKPVEF